MPTSERVWLIRKEPYAKSTTAYPKQHPAHTSPRTEQTVPRKHTLLMQRDTGDEREPRAAPHSSNAGGHTGCPHLAAIPAALSAGQGRPCGGAPRGEKAEGGGGPSRSSPQSPPLRGTRAEGRSLRCRLRRRRPRRGSPARRRGSRVRAAGPARSPWARSRRSAGRAARW